jgi:hypothetical protein
MGPYPLFGLKTLKNGMRLWHVGPIGRRAQPAPPFPNAGELGSPVTALEPASLLPAAPTSDPCCHARLMALLGHPLPTPPLTVLGRRSPTCLQSASACLHDPLLPRPTLLCAPVPPYKSRYIVSGRHFYYAFRYTLCLIRHYASSVI